MRNDFQCNEIDRIIEISPNAIIETTQIGIHTPEILRVIIISYMCFGANLFLITQ